MKTVLDFVLDEPLGQGSAAVVYRARRLPAGEAVALKCPIEGSPAASQALEREARLLGRTRHPNVARLIELVRMSDSDPPVALAVELIDGATLAQLAGAAPIDTWRLAEAGSDIARGLEALHDVGVIHGDVKPTNVVFRPSGQAVLIDLDAAFDPADNEDGSAPIRTTTRFAAPEALERGERTAASDVWGLAACLLDCHSPAPGPDHDPQYEDHAWADLCRLLHASLAEDPSARPDLTQLIDGLDRAAKHTSGTRSGEGVAPAAPTGGTRAERPGEAPDVPKPSEKIDRDSTVVWQPVQPNRPQPLRPAERGARAMSTTSRGRIGVTAAGVVLGVVGAIVLAGWVSDAAQGPRPSLAAGPEPSLEPIDVEAPPDTAADTSDPPAPITVDPVGPADVPPASATVPAVATPVPPCDPSQADEDAGAGSETGPTPSEGQLLRADLRAEGCTRTVSWDPVAAQAAVAWPEGARRYVFGQSGDQLVLGDWDADGTATPALYRPSTGATFTFSGWAEPGSPLPSAEVHDTGVRNGWAIARTAVSGTADQLVVEDGHP